MNVQGPMKPADPIPEFASVAVKQKPPVLLRLNLRRALQLHGRLAVGIAVTGILLAAGVVLTTKASYWGKAAIYVEPLPIGIHLASAAVALVLGFALLGVTGAVLRHRLDQRIYIAEELEQFLGVPPMAVLPDRNEVSDGANEEFLLRLTASIESARHFAGSHRFVFTSATSGTGVSLTVSRIKAMLDAMGQRAVLIDASTSGPSVVPAGVAHGDPQPLSELSGALAKASNRPTEVLRALDYFGGDGRAGERDIVLTDAAPLPLSAEAEYLVRFSDATIVVVESGRTTRRELSQIVLMLQRMRVRNVGFLLNRVALATADAVFVANIGALEERLRVSGWSAVGDRRPGASDPVQRHSSQEQKDQIEQVEEVAAPDIRGEDPVHEEYEGGEFTDAVPIFAPSRLVAPAMFADWVQRDEPVAAGKAPRVPVEESSAVASKQPASVSVPVVELAAYREWVGPKVVAAETPVITERRIAAKPSVGYEATTPVSAPGFSAASELYIQRRHAEPVPEPHVPSTLEALEEVFDPFVPTRKTMPTAFRDPTSPARRWDDWASPLDVKRSAHAASQQFQKRQAPAQERRKGASWAGSNSDLPKSSPQFIENGAPHEPAPSEREMYPYLDHAFERFEAAKVSSIRRGHGADAEAGPEQQQREPHESVISERIPNLAESLKRVDDFHSALAAAEILPPDFGDASRLNRAKRSPMDDDDDMQILPSWRGQYRRQQP